MLINDSSIYECYFKFIRIISFFFCSINLIHCLQNNKVKYNSNKILSKYYITTKEISHHYIATENMSHYT